MNIPYLSFGLDIAGTITAVTRLLTKRTPITQAQLWGALQPAVESFEATFNVTMPRQVVEAVCKAAADAVNRYVIADVTDATVDKDGNAA